MKRKEAKTLYELYLDYLTRADELEQAEELVAASNLRDMALEVEREIEEAGYSLGDFK